MVVRVPLASNMSQSRLAWGSNTRVISGKKSSLGKHFAKQIETLSIIEVSKKKKKKKKK